jgi:hypothetical protein
MELRFNGLQVVNGFPEGTVGQLGDLATLLTWHRNDPPDDYEMNRNNVVYTWQYNRNPLIDYPDLVEYIWGSMAGEVWDQPLGVEEEDDFAIQLYPNPTSGRIYLQGIKESTMIDVFSIDGRRLLNYTIDSSSWIDLNLSSGLYVLRITSEGKLMTKKILVR